MRGRLISAAIILAVVGVTTPVFIKWKAVVSERHAACTAARQHMETLEINMRAMAAGLSPEAFAETEKAQVSKLVKALDTATNDSEVEAVIDEHAAELEAQDAAIDAELNNQGSQLFLEQRLKKQRITTDIKQEIKRAEKAVTEACD